MMANFDLNDPMAMHFMGDNPSAYQLFGPYPGDPMVQEGNAKSSNETEPFPSQETLIPDDNFLSSLTDSVDPLDIPTDTYSRSGTPAGAFGGDGWESFVDFGSEQ